MLTTAVVRIPAKTFANGLTSQAATPNYQQALQQHDGYCRVLEACGLSLIRLDADERFPDSTFVEDTAVVLANPTRTIFSRPGASSRTGEVEGIREAITPLTTAVHEIVAPGTLDGGDVCEVGEHFFIGVSKRTNEAGGLQLATFLSAYGLGSTLVDIRDCDEILHLKSGIAHLGDGRLAVIESLAANPAFHNYEIVLVPKGEEYAANCVSINQKLLIAAGYPLFQQTLKQLGYQTVSLEMSEFRTMDGGLSCLSLRF
jgi:dimethylargininase